MRRTMKIAIAVLGAAALAAVVASGLYPFETFVAFRQFALWRNGIRAVRLHGGLAAYEKNGCEAGRPCRCVALIHGLGDSALNWDKMLLDPRASAGVRLLAPNMPGTDGSDPPSDPSGYGIGAQSRTLRAALEGVCPEWTIAANSLGGWISLRLALDWPQGVRGLILIDAAGVDDPSGRAEASARTLENPTVESMRGFSRLARYGGDRKIPERAWRSAVESMRRRPTGATVRAMSRAELLDGRLSALRVPTRIIWGDADGIIPVSVGASLHRQIKGSRLQVVARCGHLPQQECPDSVARALFEP